MQRYCYVAHSSDNDNVVEARKEEDVKRFLTKNKPFLSRSHCFIAFRDDIQKSDGELS